MTTALTLLITAMQLLTMVANTPNLSAEFKNMAIEIGNRAVQVAQEEIAKANETVVEPVVIPQVTNPVQVQNPTFSAIIIPMNKLSMRKLCVDDLAIGNENGLFCELTINYTDQNNKNLLDKELVITSNGTGQFVNYHSPQFVSTTTNQLKIKTKRLGSGISGQIVTYQNPNKTAPTFTVTVEELTTTE